MNPARRSRDLPAVKNSFVPIPLPASPQSDRGMGTKEFKMNQQPSHENQWQTNEWRTIQDSEIIRLPLPGTTKTASAETFYRKGTNNCHCTRVQMHQRSYPCISVFIRG
jgi:hypothetical protein